MMRSKNYEWESENIRSSLFIIVTDGDSFLLSCLGFSASPSFWIVSDDSLQGAFLQIGSGSFLLDCFFG